MSAVDQLLSLLHLVTVRERDEARAKAARLRAALEELALYEMQYSQIEHGYEVGGSDGWECALCFDEPGDPRPSFETAADVTHRTCCALYEGP